MVYNSQKGQGLHDLFGTMNRTFKPVLEGVADVGVNLATGLVSDLLSGKTPKASVKERGNQAKSMVAQRALVVLERCSRPIPTRRPRGAPKTRALRGNDVILRVPPPLNVCTPRVRSRTLPLNACTPRVRSRTVKTMTQCLIKNNDVIF